MKGNLMKKATAMATVCALALGTLAGCSGGSDNSSSGDAAANTQAAAGSEAAGNENNSEAAGDEGSADAGSQGEGSAGTGGTIMWLSNISSGIAYDTAYNYASMICEELGYDFQVVYGDSYNDPAGNLNAVKNGMTSDVVGLIVSQDGGIKDIMAEYPDLYVAGYNTDLISVFADDGANKDVLTNEKFLGTICDGHYDGTLIGKDYAQSVIEKGYKKVATIIFPGYAYPMLPVADEAFRAEIAAYNETVSDEEKIEIVGEAKVLEFMPLDESFFLEEGNGDLDAIAAFCAGTMFVYPTMKSAMANGSCSADTKLITGGFDNDEAIVADIGGDGVIQYIAISPAEDIAWSIIMLENALNGTMYSDFAGPERIDPVTYVIDTKERIDNVMSKSMAGTADVTKAQLSMDDIKSVITRFNPDATYADLDALFHSDQLTTDALADK